MRDLGSDLVDGILVAISVSRLGLVVRGVKSSLKRRGDVERLYALILSIGQLFLSAVKRIRELKASDIPATRATSFGSVRFR